VKGPSFIGLHELFDKVAEAVEGYVDQITACIVNPDGHPGAGRFIRPWRVNGENAPASSPLPSRASWSRRWFPRQL